MIETSVKKIKKRDGRIVKFEQDKVTDAIFRAAVAIGGSNRTISEKLSELVVKILEDKFDGHTTPTVEQVQDIIEKVLIEDGHAQTAKAYILYRKKRAEIRKAKAVLGVSDDIKLSLDAIRILEKNCLLKEGGKPSETPKELFQRVSKRIAQLDLKYGGSEREAKKSEKEFYNIMTLREFIPDLVVFENGASVRGAINLSKMLSYHSGDAKIDYPKIRSVIKISVHFLDNLAKGDRKIELGVMAFADMLIHLGIPYTSEEALRLGTEVMEFISFEGELASKGLGKKRGGDQRNSSVTAIFDTEDMSTIADCSNGIKPLPSLSTIAKDALDQSAWLIKVNPLFEEIANKKGFYSDELMKQVAVGGTIANLDVPKDIKELFVTETDMHKKEYERMFKAFKEHADSF